jgi:hypothetical protein
MAEVDEASVKLDFQNFGLSGEKAAIDGRIGSAAVDRAYGGGALE